MEEMEKKVNEKKCPMCEEMKVAAEFHKSKKSKDGLQTYCKGCNRKYSKNYYRENEEQGKQNYQFKKQNREQQIDKSMDKCVEIYLKEKGKEFFINKTPKEIYQEFGNEFSSKVIDKRTLNQQIQKTYRLIVKPTLINGKTTRVYRDSNKNSLISPEDFLDLQKEEWKSIQGYDGYFVSTHGRVKSTIVKGKIKLLKQNETNSGYLKVGLSKDGKTDAQLVHRLVAKAFISNPQNYPCIDHFDMNKHNNHLSNLRWCSYEQNQFYAQQNRPLLDTHRHVLDEVNTLNGNLAFVKGGGE
jgi:hypothetical protein